MAIGDLFLIGVPPETAPLSRSKLTDASSSSSFLFSYFIYLSFKPFLLSRLYSLAAIPPVRSFSPGRFFPPPTLCIESCPRCIGGRRNASVEEQRREAISNFFNNPEQPSAEFEPRGVLTLALYDRRHPIVLIPIAPGVFSSVPPRRGLNVRGRCS